MTAFALSLAILILTGPSKSVSAASGAGQSNARNRGAELFATRGCAHCHGAAGVGGGRGPDLQEVRKRLKASQIATQIHDGGKSMPPYGDDLTPAELNDLVEYLRAKRKFIAPAPPPANPPGAPL